MKGYVFSKRPWVEDAFESVYWSIFELDPLNDSAVYSLLETQLSRCRASKGQTGPVPLEEIAAVLADLWDALVNSWSAMQARLGESVADRHYQDTFDCLKVVWLSMERKLGKQMPVDLRYDRCTTGSVVRGYT